MHIHIRLQVGPQQGTNPHSTANANAMHRSKLAQRRMVTTQMGKHNPAPNTMQDRSCKNTQQCAGAWAGYKCRTTG